MERRPVVMWCSVRKVPAFDCDRLQGLSFCFHPDVAVVTKHLAVDVTGNLHDGLVAGAAFGKFRNEGVPVIVPAACHLRILARGLPRRLERGNVPRGIGRHRPAPGEDVPLLPDFTESLAIPCAVFDDMDRSFLWVRCRGIQRRPKALINLYDDV